MCAGLKTFLTRLSGKIVAANARVRTLTYARCAACRTKFLKFANAAIIWLRNQICDYSVQACIALLILAVVLVAYIFALDHANAGEVAGAIGSLVGGFVGAVGAIYAVFLAMSRQRSEERTKVSGAIQAEVLYLCKYVTGTLDVCIKIANGTVKIPRRDADNVARNLLVDPVVYPAVADRIGLLPHPLATVGFYTRIAEVKAMLAILAKPPEVSQTMYVAAPPDFLNKNDAQCVAVCLITALDHAKPILRDDADPDYRDQLSLLSRKVTLSQIEDSLSAAQLAFPGAETIMQREPASSS